MFTKKIISLGLALQQILWAQSPAGIGRATDKKAKAPLVLCWTWSKIAIIGWLVLGTALKATANPSIVADGTYLYGESPKPHQMDKDYIVFQVKDGQVKGAIYRPNSEFYCFTGQVKGEQLKLSFVDPSDGRVYQDEIGIRTIEVPIASQKLPMNKLSLNGFYPLEKLTIIDHQILSSCLANKA